ncbi:MAG: hypothetical protein ACAH80_11730 [Alphaproteobacteria bacterium]
MMKGTRKFAALSLAALAVFSGAACTSKTEPPKDREPAPVIETLPGPAKTDLGQPYNWQAPAVEEAEPEPEPTAPPMDYAETAAYTRAVTSALQKAGYLGRESLDVKAELERRAALAEKAEQSDEDAAEASEAEPRVIAKNAFGELSALRDVYVYTAAPFYAETTNGYAWVQQIRVLGDISVTAPAVKGEDGKIETPEMRYGKMLTVTITMPADAEKQDEVSVTVDTGWGNTDGRAIHAGGLDDLSPRQYQHLTGSEGEAEESSSEFTWKQRQQAMGAIGDWLRDNTSTTPAPKPVTAPKKAATASP